MLCICKNILNLPPIHFSCGSLPVYLKTMSRFRKKAPAVETTTASVPKALLQQACKTGQLNLSGRDLKQVPDEVWNIYSRPNEEDVKFDSMEYDQWWSQVELKKLLLASNQLSFVPDTIAVFSTLVILDLHDNKLTMLPNAISQMKVLEKLDVSHNELTQLPEDLSDLQRLSTLLLQHNVLVSLPQSFGGLGSLTNLDISNNKLEEIPDDWSQINNLLKLNMSSNQLTKLPASICRNPLLGYLDLASNKLSRLPDGWTNLSSLKELYLRNNNLDTLPNLRQCNKLKELYCARNSFIMININVLPESLMIVEFRDNKIKEINEDIVQLQNLQRLDVSNNDISTLPPIIGTMEGIKALNVDGNPMRGIRRDIISKGTMSIMKYLRTRIVIPKNSDDHRHGDSSLPVSAGVAQHTKLHSLNISKTLDLSKKPFSRDDLLDCSTVPLESINFNRAGLTELPDELSHFSGTLKILSCSLNKISHLGCFIGTFTSLTHLDLASNLLESLPKEMSNLQALIELNIMQNRFKFIPDCVFSLSSLENLLASGNQIEKIDANGLRRLEKLSTLSLQNNSISQVPPELGLISSLRSIQLEGNIFRIPRQNILQQGTVAVLEYLKGRVPNR